MQTKSSKTAKPKAAAKPAAKKPAASKASAAKDIGKVPAVNPADLGNVARAHNDPDVRIKKAQVNDPRLTVLERPSKPVRDPIKGFVQDTEEGKAALKEDQHPDPILITKEAKERAEVEVVPAKELEAMGEKLMKYRNDIDTEMPDLVPAFNKLISGVLEFKSAQDARRERIYMEGQREAKNIQDEIAKQEENKEK
jgi:hypothetical protein